MHIESFPYLCPRQKRQTIGKMPEWSIGTVSKTVVPLRVPRVRIPLFPQKKSKSRRLICSFLYPFFRWIPQEDNGPPSREIHKFRHKLLHETRHRSTTLLRQTYPQTEGRRECAAQGEDTGQKHGIVRCGIAMDMEAEKLLIRELKKHYSLFSKYRKDALILTVLSYNVGHGTLLGYGKHPKSRLLKKLEAGDRDIYKEYISYCHYKGRKIRSIERRRKMEFLLLYEK